MLYGDRPILSPRQDALGRAGFALELARAIDNLNLANDGFVMGLLGDWGSGKSSVIELIVRYLRHIEMMSASSRPIFGEANAQPRTLDALEDMSLVPEPLAATTARHLPA
jgi:ABC-type glutathione transport system ATPase component